MMETLDMLIDASNSSESQNTFISDAKQSFIRGKYHNLSSQYSNLAGYYSNSYDNKKKNTLSTIDHVRDMHTGDKSKFIAETLKAIREVKSLLWTGSRKEPPPASAAKHNNFMRRTAKAIGKFNVKKSLGKFFKKKSGELTNRLARLNRSGMLTRMRRRVKEKSPYIK